MEEQIVIPIAGMTMVVLLALGIPFVRALVRRWEREPPLQPTVPPEVVARLERIEQAVDAVAIEVERISEGQRFTTKLLSDRAGESAPEPHARGAGT
jgi:Na+-transporting methylmalonyl-CoA/oxaloacetate decarboxylase gamma subunit